MEIVFFIVGLILAAVGGFLFWDARRFASTAVRGEGRVIGFAVKESRRKSGGGRTTYSPVVSYEHQGESYELTGRVSSSHVTREIGDRVKILISPDNPGDARLDGPAAQILGGIFLLVGLGAMVLFFFIFDFSLLSMGIAVVVIAVLVTQAIMKLRAKGIHSMADLKAVASKAKSAHRSGEAGIAEQGEARTVVTDVEEFESGRRGGKAGPWVMGVFLLVGLGALVGGGILAKQRADFLASALTATGEVIDFERRTSTSDGRTTTTYYPVVRYQPPGRAETFTFEHDSGSSSPGYRRGESVTVLYAPDDPGDAIIDAGLLNWLGPSLMIVLGGVFALVGGLGLRSRTKQRKQQPPPAKLDF